MYIAKTKQTINLKRIFVNLSKFNVLLNNKTYTWEELQKNTLNMNSQKHVIQIIKQHLMKLIRSK